jgi:hypothetical protein
MKPRELVAKLNLANGKLTRAKVDALMAEMRREATEVIESFRVNDDISKFHQAVKVIRSKWDGVSNKVPYGLDEKQWNYFYASVLVPLRDQLCPTYLARKREAIGKKVVSALRNMLSSSESKSEANEKLRNDETLKSIFESVDVAKLNPAQRETWLERVNGPELLGQYGKVTEYIRVVIEDNEIVFEWQPNKISDLDD